MPDNPKGMKGLGQIITYLLELKETKAMEEFKRTGIEPVDLN
jgi:hypothetical protein